MSRIRSRGNQATEIALVKLLRRNKITGWRRHFEIREVEGEKRKFKVRPDFVFHKSRTAIFVDGCFWHGCPKHGTQPAGNRAFWKRKFARNLARDRLVNRVLRRANWQVLRIWEHELSRNNEKRLLRRIHKALHGRSRK